MTERIPQPDSNEPPEDVASLYSWANLHGAKYRDFSASRAQIREKARQRVDQAIEEERLKVRQETEAQRAAEAARGQEGRSKVEPAAQQAAELTQPVSHPRTTAATASDAIPAPRSTSRPVHRRNSQCPSLRLANFAARSPTLTEVRRFGRRQIRFNLRLCGRKIIRRRAFPRLVQAQEKMWFVLRG